MTFTSTGLLIIKTVKMRQIKEDVILRIKVLLASAGSKHVLTEEDALIIKEFEQNLHVLTIGIRKHNSVKVFRHIALILSGVFIVLIFRALFCG